MVDAGNNAVEVRSLRKQFGDFVAVDGIDLTIPEGEIFGFIGPNGSGKSTTIKMLLGLIQPTSGEATVLGYDIRSGTEEIRRRIGYMAQKFSLYNDLTAAENLDFYANVYGITSKEAPLRIAGTLELLGISQISGIIARELSTGWRQRLALACAIIHRPRLLFLDEPTGGVDPLARREFWHLLYKMADSGVTIFVTTHYMDEADYCHHLALINAGQIVADGSPLSVKAEAGSNSLDEIFSRVVSTGMVKQ